jgi:hypothetical protein
MGVGDSARSFKRIKAQIPSNVFNEGHVCVTEQHRIELVELPEDVTQTTLATTHSFIYNELVSYTSGDTLNINPKMAHV